MAARETTTTGKKTSTLVVIPSYTTKQLCNALVRLGFVKKKSHNHQHKFKHPSRKPMWGNKACVVFPDDLSDRKLLQQVVVKQIAANFGFTVEEVVSQLK